LIEDALDLAAVDIEFAGDGALAVAGLVPGPYGLSRLGAPGGSGGVSCASPGAPTGAGGAWWSIPGAAWLSG